MFFNKIKFILILLLLYQTPLYSKSTSFEDFNPGTLSNYFSGIVAFENKDNSKSLDFFNTSKVLLNKHEPYFKRYIYTLVLENKINEAINIIKHKKNRNDLQLFESYLLLTIDSLKKNNFTEAFDYLSKTKEEFNETLNSIKRQVNQCAPHALTLTKNIIRPRNEIDIDLSAKIFADCIESEEGKEGIKSFFEKKKPYWAVRS